MELELTVCAADETLELVKARDKQGVPFGLVLSMQGPADGVQGRAPRLASEIGPEWADRQVFLYCNDVETGAGAPPRELVESALGHIKKCPSDGGVTRVLVHCRRGKSRSTALGLVLLRHHRGPGTEKQCLEELLRVRPLAAPNIAIVKHGDELLGCGGKLVNVVESDPDVTRRRAEASVARAPVSALISWHAGFADQARSLVRESLSAAEDLKKFEHIARALTYACSLYRELREPLLVHDFAQRLITVAGEHQSLSALGSVHNGWALSQLGQSSEGIPLIRAGLDWMMRNRGETTALTALSEAQACAGLLNEAVATIDQTLDAARKSAIELEFVLWRRARLHMLRGDLASAEKDLTETLKLARGVGSAVYELRALSGLKRLAKGGREKAGTMLAEVYNRFSEGFDTVDMKDAKALLDELA